MKSLLSYFDICIIFEAETKWWANADGIRKEVDFSYLHSFLNSFLHRVKSL